LTLKPEMGQRRQSGGAAAVKVVGAHHNRDVMFTDNVGIGS
jgi:hypothetical protein